MKRIRRKLSIILGVILICSLALLSACGERENRGYDDSLISPDWYSEKMNMSSAKDYTEEEIKESGKMLSESSGYPVVVSVEDMVAHSSLIVRGRVLGFDYLVVEHATRKGDTEVFTNYYVEVLDVLRGEPCDTEVISVRRVGGESDNTIFMDLDLDITVGNEYLFFLWMPKTVGTSFSTDGDYYYIVDGTSGYFKGGTATTKNAEGVTVPKKFSPGTVTSLNNEDLNYLEFVEKIKEYNETIPIDENFRRKQVEEAYANNLESGMMTQEEYDEAMAEFDKYGTILYYTQPGDITVNP